MLEKRYRLECRRILYVLWEKSIDRREPRPPMDVKVFLWCLGLPHALTCGVPKRSSIFTGKSRTLTPVA